MRERADGSRPSPRFFAASPSPTPSFPFPSSPAPVSDFQTLQTETDADGVLVITLDRPDALNALSQQLVAELGKAMRLARRDDVKGVVITGAGEKAFAAGADISEFAGMEPLDAHRFAARGQAVFTAIENTPKPVVAAVNGFALGGGCELAMACHLRVASEAAQFGPARGAAGPDRRLRRDAAAAPAGGPRHRHRDAAHGRARLGPAGLRDRARQPRRAGRRAPRRRPPVRAHDREQGARRRRDDAAGAPRRRAPHAPGGSSRRPHCSRSAPRPRTSARGSWRSSTARRPSSRAASPCHSPSSSCSSG